MATRRWLTPAGVNSGTVTASCSYADGTIRRSYSANSPGFMDCQLPDDVSLQQFVPVGVGSGTTAQRPPAASVGAGSFYIDTSLAAAIVSDGSIWRSPVTGAAV